jgi:hypothetical protein
LHGERHHALERDEIAVDRGVRRACRLSLHRELPDNGRGDRAEGPPCKMRASDACRSGSEASAATA